MTFVRLTAVAATLALIPIAGMPGKAAAESDRDDAAAVAAALLQRPAVDAQDGWPAGVYAMDPSLRPALSQQADSGVRLVEPDEYNEIDAAADAVRVVSADELNEIDLPAGTTGQAATESATRVSAAAASAPVPASWLGGLMIAVGGVIAAASALRLFAG